ncbi:MAG TPA: O-antigen ligase family protein [Candidatus Polarisedimenticolia bacterium]|nr:O-antigen ligase family protein [Candidatus Polarisedimenticolia bacterium]
MGLLPEVCDRVTGWGLVGLIIFTPLAFGTVEPWAIALMEWGVATLALVFCLGRLWPEREGPRPAGDAWTGMEFPLALFILFCALQTLPLPPWILQRLSPGSARMYAGPREPALIGTAETALAAGAISGGPALSENRPVSVNPRDTWSRVRLLTMFGALFLLTSSWGRRGRVVFLLWAVTITGFLISMFALVQFLTWNGKIYWVRRIPAGMAFGPFVNHNHFAGYVEMIIPVSIGLALYTMEIRRSRHHGSASAEGGGEGPGRGAENIGRWVRGALASFMAVILLVALFFCKSRGGIVSTVVSGAILFVIVWRRIGSRRVAWSLAVALPLLVILLILWIGPGGKRELVSYATIEGEASLRLRLVLWERLIHELPHYLWVGSGLGTFEDGFAPYVPPGSPRRWDRAHNDYLQILWETGVVGAVLCLTGIVVFVRRYWWPAFRSRIHPFDILRMGIAVSLLCIALHSIGDFNLQIGSNGFLFALLAGLLVALDREVGQEGPRPSP